MDVEGKLDTRRPPTGFGVAFGLGRRHFVLHLAHGVAHGWAQPPLLVIRPSRTPYHLPGDACTSLVIWLLFYNMWALPRSTNGEWYDRRKSDHYAEADSHRARVRWVYGYR